MLRFSRLCVLVPALFFVACDRRRATADSVSEASAVPVVDSFPNVPESAWIEVVGPTMVGFFPRVSDALLSEGGDLAELLDHFSFNLGMATDSLEAHGVRVTMRSGDTLRLRAATRRWRFVRDTDSALVGFYVTAPDQRHAVRYGTGVEFDLVAYGLSIQRAKDVSPPDTSP